MREAVKKARGSAPWTPLGPEAPNPISSDPRLIWTGEANERGLGPPAPAGSRGRAPGLPYPTANKLSAAARAACVTTSPASIRAISSRRAASSSTATAV